MNDKLVFESDLAVSARCMDVLVRQVGLLETERFVAHLSRERMDYTNWRQDQFEDMSLEDLAQATRKAGDEIRGIERMRSAIGARRHGLAESKNPLRRQPNGSSRKQSARNPVAAKD